MQVVVGEKRSNRLVESMQADLTDRNGCLKLLTRNEFVDFLKRVIFREGCRLKIAGDAL